MTKTLAAIAVLPMLAASSAAFCERAVAQTPGSAPKAQVGATANSNKALPPSGSIGGRTMLKPGQAFIGGKMSAPPAGIPEAPRRP
jgi:hypothetical protein